MTFLQILGATVFTIGALSGYQEIRKPAGEFSLVTTLAAGCLTLVSGGTFAFGAQLDDYISLSFMAMITAAIVSDSLPRVSKSQAYKAMGVTFFLVALICPLFY